MSSLDMDVVRDKLSDRESENVLVIVTEVDLESSVVRESDTENVFDVERLSDDSIEIERDRLWDCSLESDSEGSTDGESE